MTNSMLVCALCGPFVKSDAGLTICMAAPGLSTTELGGTVIPGRTTTGADVVCAAPAPTASHKAAAQVVEKSTTRFPAGMTRSHFCAALGAEGRDLSPRRPLSSQNDYGVRVVFEAGEPQPPHSL
jgi:hypothetical protein